MTSTATAPPLCQRRRHPLAVWLPLCLAACGRPEPDAVEPAPTAAAVRTLVAELAQHFEAGDEEAFFACFSPLHPAQHSDLRSRYGPHIRAGRLSCDARVVADRVAGRHRVATIRLDCHQRGTGAEPVVARGEFVLVAASAGGAARGVLLAPVKAGGLTAMAAATGGVDRFECPACNYSIAGTADWVMVPATPAEAGCMEGVTYYSLADEVAVALTVHVTDRAAASTPARDRLLAFAAAAGVSPTAVADWLPPAHAAAPLAGLDGARCEVDAGGQAAALQLVRYAGFEYLIEARGAPAALAADAERIAAVVDSFRILQPETVPGEALDRLLAGHDLGTVHEGEFVHATANVRFRAPAGWSMRIEPDHQLFHVRMEDPTGRQSIDVEGMRPSTERWTEQAADLTTRAALVSCGYTIAEDSGWRARTETPELMAALDDCVWHRARRCELRCPEGLTHRVELVLSDAVLLVVRLHPENAAGAAALEAVLAGLRTR